MNYYSELCSELKSITQSFSSQTIYIGLSGGLDSRLLLQAACAVFPAPQVVAIHVHHGLSMHADQWLAFCQETCKELGCSFVAERVAVSTADGVEAGARAARYQAFTRIVQPGCPLLLAHHLDDQVETFFLRLMRGSGVMGLQGMSRLSERDGLTIVRPWLDFARQQLLETATALGVHWVDDESNASDIFDRNYLRLTVLPLLEARWPKYRDRIQRLMKQVNQSEQVENDTTVSIDVELQHRLSHDGGLKWVDLDHWSEQQKLTLLHRWLSGLGVLVPSQTRLQSILSDVVGVAIDAQPKVDVSGGFVSRHGPALYWVPALQTISPAPSVLVDELALWKGVGELGIVSGQPYPSLRADLPDLHWRLREGGETMRPLGRSKSRDLKRLMQEYRIKPWLRDRTPLLFSGEELVAIGNELISAEHLCLENELGYWPMLKNVD